MTEQPPTEAIPEKSEKTLQRYLTWLGIEQLNVAHRVGAYSVQEIHGLKCGGICTRAYRDIGPDIADMALPDLVSRAAKVLETVDLSPTGPDVLAEHAPGLDRLRSVE